MQLHVFMERRLVNAMNVPAVFKEAICVTNSEMKFALEQYMEHRKKQMGSTFEPPPVVKKTMVRGGAGQGPLRMTLSCMLCAC